MAPKTPRTTCRSALFFCGLLALPSAAAAQTAEARDALYISAPFVGLANGLFDGEVTFPQIRTRSVAGQKPPYRRLIEVIKDQVTFDLENVSGTIVGFRVPGYLEGVNVPGYHMHFLTADRKAGGHVLAFRANRLRVAADTLTTVHVDLPRDPRFSTKDFQHLDRMEMDQILGRVPLGEAPRPK